MTREKILELVKGHKERDELERQSELLGSRIALYICGVLGTVIVLIQLIKFGKINLGIVALIFCGTAVENIKEGYTVEDKRSLITGILCAVGAAGLFIASCFFGGML